jgi:hypothetical protein
MNVIIKIPTIHVPPKAISKLLQLPFLPPEDRLIYSALQVTLKQGRAIAQAVSRWLPTAAVRGSKPGFVVGQSGAGAGFLRVLRFPLQSSFVPPITPQSPSCIIRVKCTIGQICGRSTGAYTNLGDLQRELMGGLSPTPPNKKKSSCSVPPTSDVRTATVLVLQTVTHSPTHSLMERSPS